MGESIDPGRADVSPNVDNAQPVDLAPVLDRQALAMLRDPDFGGDPEFLADLIDVFFADTPPRLEALSAAVATASPTELARAAHALKGSTGNLGIRRMQELCAEIERLGRHGSTDGAASKVARLRREYETASAALISFLSPDVPPTV
ncbi:MAG: Hpt domain-containing protein [Chloroflexi bacterium]|nr:Hpt domain-containing protein [Chloroflexota bacterium]